MKSTAEAMSEIYTQLTGKNRGVMPLVEACNLILEYVKDSGFGGISKQNIETIIENKGNMLFESKEGVKTQIAKLNKDVNISFSGFAGGIYNFSYIQDDIEKLEGQYYLDKNTGNLVKCIRTTSSIVNSVEYFKDMSIDSIVTKLENLIKVDNGITGDYTNVGAYNFTFPKIYKQVIGVAINIYKTGTATTLENVYLTGFNNTSFSFVKDCVEAARANTVRVVYTVFYV